VAAGLDRSERRGRHPRARRRAATLTLPASFVRAKTGRVAPARRTLQLDNRCRYRATCPRSKHHVTSDHSAPTSAQPTGFGPVGPSSHWSTRGAGATTREMPERVAGTSASTRTRAAARHATSGKARLRSDEATAAGGAEIPKEPKRHARKQGPARVVVGNAGQQQIAGKTGQDHPAVSGRTFQSREASSSLRGRVESSAAQPGRNCRLPMRPG